MLIYTHCWELMNSVGSHGSLSLPFVMKVMVCHFVSDSHEVMTALIVVLPLIVVVVISLQLHRSLFELMRTSQPYSSLAIQMERHYLTLYFWRIDHFSRRSSLPELSLCAECHGGREDLKVRARKGLHLKTELVFKFSESALLAPACEEEAAILQSRCCICSRFLLVPNKCSSQMWKNS